MARNLSLEGDLQSLRNNYAEAIDDCAAGRDKLKKFEAEVQSKAQSEEEAVLHFQAGIEALTMENEKLKSENCNQSDYIKKLETSIKSEEEAANNLKASIEALTSEKEKLKSKTRNQCDNIKNLESSNMIASEAADNLRKEIGVLKEKHKTEKAELITDHKTRIKALKKVVSDQTKTADKLSVRIQDLENNVNPAAITMSN